MKKLTAIFISLIVVFASGFSCFADGLYRVDAQSGQIVGTGSADSDEVVEYIRLSSTCAYDKSSEMFIYTGIGAAGNEFSCSVYNGMYVNIPVSLKADPTAQLKVFLNGEEQEFTGDAQYSKPGTYIVRDKANSLILGFTILGDVTNAVYSYDIPSLFRVDTAVFNGNDVKVDNNCLIMKEDGSYYVSYFCYETGVTYSLSLVVDHTPPVLEIDGVDEKGYAHNVVTLGDTERHSTVEVARDGNEVSFAPSYKDAGDYRIVYTDEAGNSSTYEFTIMQFLDLNAWMAVLIAVLLLIGVSAFMIYTRTHMRVR